VEDFGLELRGGGCGFRRRAVLGILNKVESRTEKYAFFANNNIDFTNAVDVPS